LLSKRRFKREGFIDWLSQYTDVLFEQDSVSSE
jgi:hypothetical protein